MATEEERRMRQSEADAIENKLKELERSYSTPVENNTLEFDDALLKKEREAREKETAKQINEAKFDASQIVSSAVELYASSNGDIQYIKSKSRQEISTLEDIMNQIRLNKEAIDNIMDLIRGGVADNQTYKAFSDLQKTNIELLKMKQASLSKLEESLKQLRSDIEINNAVDAIEEENSKGDLIPRNTRELMKVIEEAQKSIGKESESPKQTKMEF